MKSEIGIIDLLLISPLIVLFLTSLLPITIKIIKGNNEQAPLATLFQIVGGIISAIILNVGIYNVVDVGVHGKTAFNNALVFDGISLFSSFIALLITAGVAVLIYEGIHLKGKQLSEVMFLLLSSAIGMLIMVWSNDLLTLYIGLETMSLPLYMLISMSHEQTLSKEASLKYFILGGLASAIFLYGIALVFGAVGSTYLPDITKVTMGLVTTSRLFLIGSAFLVIGFCFKVAIFPFHTWAPDVYQGAPTSITTYLNTAIKLVSFVAFLRIILLGSLNGSYQLFDVLQWLAVLTMFVGNTAAIFQDNFKRMLAYSSIAHSGYALVGIIAAGIGSDPAFGSSTLMFYLFSYSIMTFGAFAIVSLFEKKEESILLISDLSGFAKRHPWYGAAITIFMLSLAGIPPTVGFFGKFYLFTAAIGEGLIWLAIWGVINSVISVYYYLRPVMHMYMHEDSSQTMHAQMLSTKVTVFVAMTLVVVSGIFSAPFFRMVEGAIRGLF